MKGCKSCGCKEFVVDGWINCKGFVNLEEGGPDNVIVERPDDTDFEKSDDSSYTCRECGAEYDYEDICEMADDEDYDEDEDYEEGGMTDGF